MSKAKRSPQKITKKTTSSKAELLNLANLGNTFLMQGNIKQAIENYRKVLSINPGLVEINNNLGVALQQQGKFDLAIKYHEHAILLKPDYSQAYLNLGMAYNDLKMFEQAIGYYRQAILLEPNYTDAYYNLGITFKNQGNLIEAAESFHKALSLNPDFSEAYLNLGVVFNELENFSMSIECYHKANQLRPNHANTHYNLAIALRNQGHLNEAIESYRRTLSLNPSFVDAHINLSFLLLSLGRFEEGWGCHELRHSSPDATKTSIPFNFPKWRGENIKGKSLVIWREQGLGDEIQFSRYVDILKAQGASHITWVCKKPLKSLLSTLKGVNAVLTEQEAAATISTHDYWTFALSIPLYCNTTLETIPATVPYLYANPNQVQQISAELNHIKALKVGVCWQGNPKHINDRNRTPGIMQFERLFRLPKVRFFTLQPETRTEFMTAAGTAGVDMGREIDETTFEDAAALIANLDLVISCDTSICHLAGALGKPVWVVLPFEADWRWLRNREDSPWYPNTRLFRQTKAGHWTEVFERVESQLKKLINSSR